MSADLRTVILQAADDLANAMADRSALILVTHDRAGPNAAIELASIVGAAGAAEGVLRMVAALLDDPPSAPSVRSEAPRDERGRYVVRVDGNPIHLPMAARMTGGMNTR